MTDSIDPFHGDGRSKSLGAVALETCVVDVTTASFASVLIAPGFVSHTCVDRTVDRRFKRTVDCESFDHLQRQRIVIFDGTELKKPQKLL